MNKLEKFDVDDMKSFDVKDYVLKVISHWKLFLFMLFLGLIIAFFVNKHKQRIYSLDSLIVVKEEQNPLFTSSTNIAFNWGGPSDKVETIINVLKSRSHNEKVVKKLKYYIDYLQQGDYRLEDVYGKVPFEIVLDSSSYNIAGVPIRLSYGNDGQVTVSVEFEEDEYKLVNYNNDKTKSFAPKEKSFSRKVSLVEQVALPFCHFKIITTDASELLGKEYFIRFNSFNNVVRSFQGIDAKTKTKGTSLIALSLKGTNKKKIEDYINATVEVLDKDQQDQKIQYAIRTKEYIDQVFDSAAINLNNIEKELGEYRRKNNAYDLSTEGQTLFVEFSQLDKQKQLTKERLVYFNNLESYLNSNSEVTSDIPAPANLSLEDVNITKNLGQLMELSKEKKALSQTVTSDYPKLKTLNDRIKITREVVLENLKNLKSETNATLSSIASRMGNYNARLKKLPKKEQGLLTLKRTQGITAANYEYLKQKQYEAGTAIAANVSDIKILDKAKDVGQVPISPNTKFNYLIAAMLSFGLPFLYILIKEALNNKILTVEELEKLFEIPVLGVIGSSKLDTYLAVFNSPKSSMAESFRALRSNIQFLFKESKGAKTLVVTSSVSGEGKTLTSINMATVFAMSKKKTILLGLDLRKPKLHKDFDIDNEVGIVNYLIGQKEKTDIIKQTKIPNLDIITSGPVPPNPSELLLSMQTNDLMDYLKENYDYIVIDTPPVGLVADAIELFKYADATMYIVRQDYTQKGMPKMIDDKYRSGELKNISFVLNDFSMSKGYGYGYGYGYGGYNYGYGYGGYGKYDNGYHINTQQIPWYKRIFKK